jgi:hypothetical protein
MTDTDFIGIAIGLDTTCVAEFESDGGGCPVDDGNGPLHAQGRSVWEMQVLGGGEVRRR